MIKLVFLALFVLSACVPLLTPEPAPQTCEADYYRGVFVMCNMANLGSLKTLGIVLLDCKEQLRKAHELDWYDKEAPGFEWPPVVVPSSIAYD